MTTLEDIVEELAWLASFPDVSEERVCGPLFANIRTYQ